MTDPSADERFLRRAIRLAMTGRGRVEPNPMVGCVLVKDGRVIGEGCHRQFGGPHAEPTALDACTEPPAGATAYVTLEPCCHTNKKTPPCAPRLIRERIARVVVGCLDPNPAVNGGGVRMLREAGVVVDGPVLEAECRQLIAPFLKRVDHERPYVTLKWAESADGKVAGPGGRRRQISGPRSSRAVQELRGRCGGIVVGINTVLADDPTLLPRGVPTPARYDRIVLDTHLRLPTACQLVRTAKPHDVTVYCGVGESARDRIAELDGLGIDVVNGEPVDATGRLSMPAWLDAVADLGHSHLLVEPGPTLARSLLPLADRLWVVRAPTPVSDDTAPPAAPVPDDYTPVARLDLDGDVLTEYLNTRSSAYFAPAPSADLVLAGMTHEPAVERRPGGPG